MPASRGVRARARGKQQRRGHKEGQTGAGSGQTSIAAYFDSSNNRSTPAALENSYCITDSRSAAKHTSTCGGKEAIVQIPPASHASIPPSDKPKTHVQAVKKRNDDFGSDKSPNDVRFSGGLKLGSRPFNPLL